MALSKKAQAVEDFDQIQLMISDIHTVPRGKVVYGNLDSVKRGMEMWRGVTMPGPKGEIAMTVPYLNTPYPSHQLNPCMETLTSWPWVSSENRSIGAILCDMYQPDGTPDLHCPREQLKFQLDSLWKNHGLLIKTAFEYEFFVFKENSLIPLGSDHLQFGDLRVWGKHQELFGELCDMLGSLGIKVETVLPEFPPGQWELTTVPYAGVTGADVGFYVKNAVKGFFKKKGYDATFMTRPTLGSIGCGLHLNHSLWTAVAADSREENVFLGSDGTLSSTAKHWIAGLLTHADALAALHSPSLNCYRRLHGMVAPTLSTWGLDDRNACIRARVQGSNAYLEARLVSGAANPYLALAATVAAGLDGLDRRLECPLPGESSQAKEIPHTLAQALSALEKDHQLTARLGEDFVDCFVNSKRENEIKVFEKADLQTPEDQIAFERDLYLELY